MQLNGRTIKYKNVHKHTQETVIFILVNEKEKHTHISSALHIFFPFR